jgi:hypothetical protein
MHLVYMQTAYKSSKTIFASLLGKLRVHLPCSELVEERLKAHWSDLGQTNVLI